MKFTSIGTTVLRTIFYKPINGAAVGSHQFLKELYIIKPQVSDPREDTVSFICTKCNIVGAATPFVRSTTLFAARQHRCVSASYGTMLVLRPNDVCGKPQNEVVPLRAQTQEKALASQVLFLGAGSRGRLVPAGLIQLACKAALAGGGGCAACGLARLAVTLNATPTATGACPLRKSDEGGYQSLFVFFWSQPPLEFIQQFNYLHRICFIV